MMLYSYTPNHYSFPVWTFYKVLKVKVTVVRLNQDSMTLLITLQPIYLQNMNCLHLTVSMI